MAGNQIIDRRTVAIPGPTGDVTPAAQQALADTQAVRDDAIARTTSIKEQAEVAAQTATTMAGQTTALQDAAMALVLSDKNSASISVAGASFVPRGRRTARSEGITHSLLGVGDSLTEAWGDADPWMFYTASSLGWDFANLGWAGQTANQVAARYGARPPRISFPDGQIPTSGSVTVTVDVPFLSGSHTGARGGITLGVHGTLSYDGTDFTWTRTEDGDSVACSAPIPFLTDEGQNFCNWFTVFSVGRNGSDMDETMTAIDDMVAYLGSAVPRWMILDIPDAAGWPSMGRLNHALMETYPETFFPAYAWMRTPRAAELVGITFAAEDLADIDEGWTPRVFRNVGDAVHLNATGRKALGLLIAQEIRRRGEDSEGTGMPPAPDHQYVADGVTGHAKASWVDRRGLPPKTPTILPATGLPVVMAESGVRFVRFGEADRMSVDNDGSTNGSSSFAMLFKLRSTDSGRSLASCRGIAAVVDSSSHFAAYAGTGITGQAIDTQWHTLVVTRNRESAEQGNLFVDGVLSAIGPVGSGNGYEVMIGGTAAMDVVEFATWRRALSEAEATRYHAYATNRYLQ